MSYETIKFEKEEGFCLITLNRPKALNALNVKMWNEMNQVLDLINNDDNIKAFIFTGSPRPDGRPCFCAGADIKEMSTFMSGGQFAPSESTQDAPSSPVPKGMTPSAIRNGPWSGIRQSSR